MPMQLTDGEGGVEIQGLRKRFGNTQALNGVDLALPRGRVTGIAGPNGAGKSTLIRILAGEANLDEGTISLDGVDWSPVANRNTVAIVHQEPQLFPNLTIGQNLLVGRERTRATWPRPGQHEDSLLRRLELWDYRDQSLGDCSLAIQQRTEIARAVGADARLFLFDEPNSALSPAESEDLFRFLKQLAGDGRIVVLVSHRLGELVANCETVCIIRDGRVSGHLTGASLTADAIAQQLVAGNAAGGSDSGTTKLASTEAAPVLSLSNWTHARMMFRAIDLAINAGDVTAIVGVEGSGARELVRSIAGLERATGASRSRNNAPTAGVTVEYVGPDRREALFFNLSLSQNVAARLTDSRVATRFGMVRRSGMRVVGQEWVSRFHIRSESVDQPVGSLSGGNQQKVALAAAIARDPELLVLEEPTRGVDVASKRDIHQLLSRFASDRHGVLVYSTEIVEAYEAADQVYVMVAGRLAGPLKVREFADVESMASRISALESVA